jgi:hypothetical protein
MAAIRGRIWTWSGVTSRPSGADHEDVDEARGKGHCEGAPRPAWDLLAVAQSPQDRRSTNAVAAADWIGNPHQYPPDRIAMPRRQRLAEHQPAPRIAPVVNCARGDRRRDGDNESPSHLALQSATAKGWLGRLKTQITMVFPFHRGVGVCPIVNLRRSQRRGAGCREGALDRPLHRPAALGRRARPFAQIRVMCPFHWRLWRSPFRIALSASNKTSQSGHPAATTAGHGG